jgi:hypothetical protein
MQKRWLASVLKFRKFQRILQKKKKKCIRASGMAPLVQLDRMSAYGADGRRFESCTGWYENDPLQKDKSETCGAGGHRSRYLSHAKRALYHLSYSPMPYFWETCCHIIYGNFFVLIFLWGICA